MTDRPAFGWPCIERDRVRLRYNPFPPSPRQMAFLGLTCEEALFGGAAGAGKSLSLMLAALQFVDVPGYSALLLRRTLQDLKLADSLIPMSKWLLSGKSWNGRKPPSYNANENKWTFDTGAQPSSLQFGYLRNPGDELRYQGTQYQFVGFDELTQFPDEGQYLYLFSRLRRPKMEHEQMRIHYGVTDEGLTLADIPLRIRSGTNPGGPGMYWVRRRFVDPDTAIAPFLPSRYVDNPGIDVDEYRQSLAKLSEVERRRLELGDWDVFEIPGALWRFEDIRRAEREPRFETKVVAVDGAVSEGTGDECGIVVGGIDRDGIVTVLADCSLRAHPDEWSKRAVLAYHDHKCSRIVIEGNQGGEMNRMILQNAADVLGLERPRVTLVRAKAGESKEVRAQPVAQAYRAGKVQHAPDVRDTPLEAQMTSWVPGDRMSVRSPDRVDALVWLVQNLLFRAGGSEVRSEARSKLGSWSTSGGGTAARLLR